MGSTVRKKAVSHDCHVWGVSWFGAHTRGLPVGDHLTTQHRGGGGGGCLFLFVCLFFSNVPDRLSKHIELCLGGLWLSHSTRRPQPLKWRRPDVWQVNGGWAKGLCPVQVCLAWRRWAACDITRDLASTWWRGRWAAARCLNHDPHLTDLWALPPVFIAILRTHPVAESRYHRTHFDPKEFCSPCAPGMFPPWTCNKDRPTELEERWGDWRRKF